MRVGFESLPYKIDAYLNQKTGTDTKNTQLKMSY